MKRILVGLFLVLILAAAFVVVRNRPNPAPEPVADSHGSVPAPAAAPQSAMPVAPAVAPPVAVAPSDSYAERAGSSSLMFVSLYPRNIDRALEGFWRFSGQLRATHAWKASGFEDKFWEGWHQGQQNDNTPARISDEQLMSFFEQAGVAWKGLSEVALIIGGDKHALPVGESSVELPGLFLGLHFSEPGRAKAVLDQILAYSNSVTDLKAVPGLTIQQTADLDEISYVLPKPGVTIPAIVRRTGNELTWLLNSSSDNSFFTSDAAKRLVTGNEVLRRSWSSTQQPTSLFAMNAQGLLEVVDRLIAVAPPEAFHAAENANDVRESVTNALSLYHDFRTIAMASGIEHGLSSVACAEFVPGSKMAAVYMPEDTTNDADAPLLFPRVIDENVIFATVARSRVLLQQLKTGAASFRTSMKNTAVSPENLAEFDGWVLKAEMILNRFRFRELGFVVSPPILPPIVGVGVYFGGSSLKGAELLQAFVDTMNDVATGIGNISTGHTAGAAAQAGKRVEVAKIVSRGQGQPAIELSVGGLKLVGLPVGEDSIVVSIDQSIAGELRHRLEQPKSLLDSVAVIGDGLKPDVSDYLVAVNTKTFVDVIRGFVPFLLQQQQGAVKLDAKDVDELLTLLRTTFVSFQRTKPYGNSICTTAGSAFLGN